MARIALVLAHPDPAPERLCRALADSYEGAAVRAGHEVRRIDLAALDFPLLRSQREQESGPLPAALAPAQGAVQWAEHLVLVFPLWLGGMPALLKGFLEQVLRPGFAYRFEGRGWTRGLKGKSARIVVTMGMPAFAYRLFFGAFALRGLKRSILGFCGVSPIRTTLLGGVATASPAKRQGWLRRMAELGEAAR